VRYWIHASQCTKCIWDICCSSCATLICTDAV
jgi:hypothetical protein